MKKINKKSESSQPTRKYYFIFLTLKKDYDKHLDVNISVYGTGNSINKEGGILVFKNYETIRDIQQQQQK